MLQLSLQFIDFAQQLGTRFASPLVLLHTSEHLVLSSALLKGSLDLAEFRLALTELLSGLLQVLLCGLAPLGHVCLQSLQGDRC